MTFGDNLKDVRRKRRLSQHELAKHVGLSQSYICDLERNRKNVSIYVVAHLAKQLGVPVSVLFNDDTEVKKEVLRK
ncbi:XRE family transcriptional regulator [Staphylococcus arlettae]|uniref:helix-turn-helix domain-containing protein n=1 Tax=Staphylococcus arlettae TaxID=29378 RepID=UPI000D1C1A79|nr:helix-turn-helix transcriptional regulator [Staphylococcus arlettae]PTH60468.1 XRE family transcriptional regulator [Staphylococcus arlettae]RIM70584.1 XRE family transcriptional regulator [Staphylococcus arlettae]RIM74657.1 XRE family transcriptional regulator [Staphylococcus arlettae]